ncbi:MAG: ribulose-phosphate 3-epimerase [Alphaproteobacteria bacterium]|nr:ribulose-phosphate 3-epimerase [Alphaproteobacteria bacterium]
MSQKTRFIQISPSLLSADFARLGEEIKAVEPFADMIHLDVMDGHFVPNLTFGAPVIQKLRPWTSLPFDVHLMISPVDALLEDFAQAGADILTVHPEAGPHIYRTLECIKELGCKAGIALNPGTPLEMIEPVLPIVDLILIMTVNPGFGGQAFLESQLPKIKRARTLIDQTKRDILLQVDGGISPETAPSVLQAGADILVAGSAIFNNTPAHYGKNIQMLRGTHE